MFLVESSDPFYSLFPSFLPVFLLFLRVLADCFCHTVMSDSEFFVENVSMFLLINLADTL